MSFKISSTQLTLHGDIEILRSEETAVVKVENIKYVSVDNPNGYNKHVLTWGADSSEPLRIELEALYHSYINIDQEGNPSEVIPFFRRKTLLEVSTEFPHDVEFAVWDVDDSGRHDVKLARKHPLAGWQRFNEDSQTWEPFNRLLGKEDQNIWLHPALWKRRSAINWDAVIQNWYSDPEVIEAFHNANVDTKDSE